MTAKDLILATIGRLGTGGMVGHAVEYAGETIRGLTMENRMTICNMTIEGGGRAGMIAPDETTFEWVEGRPGAPEDFDAAVARWRELPTDEGASFDTEVEVDAADDLADGHLGHEPRAGGPGHRRGAASRERRGRGAGAALHGPRARAPRCRRSRWSGSSSARAPTRGSQDLREAASVVEGRKVAVVASTRWSSRARRR